MHEDRQVVNKTTTALLACPSFLVSHCCFRFIDFEASDLIYLSFSAWRDAKSNDELIDRAALRSIEQDLEDNRHQLKMKSSKGGGLGGERWGIGRSHVNDDVACDSRMPSLLSLVTNAALLVNHGVGKMRQLASDSHSTSPAPNGPADMVGGSQKRGLLSMVVERFSSHASSSQVQRDEALYRYVSGFDGFLTSLASFPPPTLPLLTTRGRSKSMS